jgi:hypothetical protein
VPVTAGKVIVPEAVALAEKTVAPLVLPFKDTVDTPASDCAPLEFCIAVVPIYSEGSLAKASVPELILLALVVSVVAEFVRPLMALIEIVLFAPRIIFAIALALLLGII